MAENQQIEEEKVNNTLVSNQPLAEKSNPKPEDSSEFFYEWQGIVWPETEILDLKRTQNGKEIKLMSYRWAANQPDSRQGIIFFIHGYGATNANAALVAKNFSLANYDVFGIDQRGQGASEGDRGNFDSIQTIYDDQWAMIFEVLKKF